jgi:hypothetical protein
MKCKHLTNFAAKNTAGTLLGYLRNKQFWGIGWLVCDHLFLRDFWPQGLLFMDVRVAITVSHGSAVTNFETSG